MFLVNQYRSQAHALSAAAYLRDHGIVAVAVQTGDLSTTRSATTAWDVMVESRDALPRATELLADLHGSRREPLDNPLPDPDLSKADPALAPPCPGCGWSLTMDASLDTCPHCGLAVDVVALIVEQHGPDALVDCYPDAAFDFDPRGSVLLCPNCEYSLAGLEMAGRCPECGEPYDKDRIFRSNLGLLP